MIEGTKFNAILYFLLGNAFTLGTKRFIYGGLIFLLSFFLLIHHLLLNTKVLYKYNKLGNAFIIITIGFIILTSLFILYKTNIDPDKKLYSLIFLLLALGFDAYKTYSINNPFFENKITHYISSLLFMLFIITINLIPDNQFILEKKYNELRNKVKNR